MCLIKLGIVLGTLGSFCYERADYTSKVSHEINIFFAGERTLLISIVRRRLAPVLKTIFHQYVISYTCGQSNSDDCVFIAYNCSQSNSNGSVLKQSHQS